MDAGADLVVVEATEPHQTAPLKEGDGLVFDAADWRSPEETEEGGRVYQVVPRLDGLLELRFANNAIRFDRVRPGDRVWRTSDVAVMQAARMFTEATAPVHTQRVRVRVVARESAALMAEWSVESQPEVRVSVQSANVLGTARNQVLSVETLREQFGRLGGTAYSLGEITLDAEGLPFAPVSVLNQMRREAVEKLEALQGRAPERRIAGAELPSHVRHEARGGEAELHLLVRTPEQLEAAIETRPASITLDYLDLYGLRPSVERVKAAGLTARVASPRVLKPGEARILNFLGSLDCPILVRATGILHALREREPVPLLIGDFSLNAANSLAATEYLKLVARLTPTHDLNAAQIADLARDAGAENMRQSLISICPCFIQSTACSAGSYPPVRVIRTADGRVRSIAWS